MSERDKKIIIKIVSVDYKTIAFRAIFEGSDYHIDDMPAYNFDLCNTIEIDNREELLKRIGQAAWMVASRQEAEENIKEYPVSKLNLRELVDKEIEMTLADAYSGSNHNPKSYIRIRKQPWYRRLFGK